MKAYTDDIFIERVPDNDPDWSYLEQPGFEARLEEYNRGGFGYIGIFAEATYFIPLPNGVLSCQKLVSSGIWGVEDDSSEEYLKSLESEELEDLKQHLEIMGIEITKNCV